MDKCLKCGQCCYWREAKKLIKCPYLTKNKLCKIYYRNRVGRKIGKNKKCSLRENSFYDFENCPYNTNKPLFHFFVEDDILAQKSIDGEFDKPRKAKIFK